MSGRGRDLAIAALLVALTCAVYAPVREFPFQNYDDPEYVSENPYVVRGLTWDGVRWAFTSVHHASWHPLTGVSHMLDVSLFGLDAGAHLLVNVALHATAAVLLFVALRRLTGAVWAPAFVAAILALHPLRVESVAWVSERKDVLSACAWMLALWAYAAWVARPTRAGWAAVVATFALGLLAKPMVITLPFVLLLLDVWPLRRWRIGRDRPAALGALVREKLALFVLAAIAGVVTYATQAGVGAVADLDAVPLGLRIANAVVSYVRYLGQMIWPVGLAVFYPLLPLSTATVAASTLFLAVVSALVVRAAPRRPYLLVGWLWYLGTLLPVIGLVKQGDQAMADRFTYLPSIGIGIMIAWGAAELAAASRTARRLLPAAAVAALVACAVVSRAQLAHWGSSERLFAHALAVTRDNYVAHTNLGIALERTNRIDEARAHYEAAVRLKPGYAKAQLNIGRMLAASGQREAAAEHYRAAMRIDPRYPAPHFNLGVLYAADGRLDDAIASYEAALRLDPAYARAHNNLGMALGMRGRHTEAIGELETALRLDPSLTPARNNLAVALEEVGRGDEAIALYVTSLRMAPGDPRVHYNLATLLEARGRTDEALAHYREAARLAPDLPEPREALGRLAPDDAGGRGG